MTYKEVRLWQARKTPTHTHLFETETKEESRKSLRDMVYYWREPQQSAGKLSRPGSTTCRILATATNYNRKIPSLEYQSRVHTTKRREHM